jgi:hypothetical protein
MAKARVLKDGFTDIDSTNIYEFSIHSDYPSQKVALAGSDTLTIPNGDNTGSITISHNLGYRPTVIATMEVENSRYKDIKGFTSATRPDSQGAWYEVFADNNDIIITVYPTVATTPAVGDVDINVKYIIPYEEI